MTHTTPVTRSAATETLPPEDAPPLASHQRITSTDINVLHDTVEPFAVGHDLQALAPAVQLDGQVNAATIGSVNLVWVRYGGRGVIVDTPPTEGEFAMCAPITPMGVEYRNTKKRSTAAGSLVLSHDEPMRMTPHPQFGCLVIATSTGRLADHLTGYLGQEYKAALRFHSDDQKAIIPVEVVERTWRHVCWVLNTAATDGIHPMVARTLEESLLTALLLGLPHTATPALAEVPRLSPHQITDTILEWIHANHHRPIGATDIADFAGIGIRQLQLICRTQWQLTPTQLLRGVRLDHARKELLKAENTPGTITQIARSAGYLHMSRFAAHYRRRFGETPSQTLSRSSATGLAYRPAPR